MATKTGHEEGNVGTTSERVTGTAPEDDGRRIGPRLTSEQVWQALAKASFAVLGYVTPSGEPRSSGVVYSVVDRRLYVVVASDSWKAKHIATSGRLAVTVPVRRGGILSLVAPIPPAAISFHATAVVLPPGSPQFRAIPTALASMLLPARLASCSIIEIVPEGAFVTYGVGVSLMKMRDTDSAQARVPVLREARTQ